MLPSEAKLMGRSTHSSWEAHLHPGSCCFTFSLPSRAFVSPPAVATSSCLIPAAYLVFCPTSHLTPRQLLLGSLGPASLIILNQFTSDLYRTISFAHAKNFYPTPKHSSSSKIPGQNLTCATTSYKAIGACCILEISVFPAWTRTGHCIYSSEKTFNLATRIGF